MYDHTYCRECEIEIEPGSICYSDPEYQGKVLCPDCFDDYLWILCDNLKEESRMWA